MYAKKVDNITLVYPPYAQRVVSPPTISPPMGLCSLAASLLKGGFKVKIIDANVEHLDNKEVVRRIKEDRPQAIGISCIFTATYNSTKDLAAQLKKETDIPIIVGGNQATAMSRHLIEDENIDFVIKGEGEISLVNLLNNLNASIEELKKIRALVFRQGKEIISSPEQEYVRQLDEIPLPPYQLFPMQRYSEYNISCSRGCPFDCTFCASKVVFGRGIRLRSVDNVIAELELLVSRYGIKPLVFYDDFFTANRAYVNELMDKMIAKKWDLKWRCATRVNLTSTNVISKMKEAGCQLIKYGVESGSPDILNTIKKGIARPEIKRALEVTKAARMPYSTFFMIGNRGENLETVKESFRLIKELDIEQASFAITVPLPGTELAQSLIKDGILDYRTIDWDLLLPLHLIDREYEKYSADLAQKWCQLTPAKILELGKIGALICKMNIFLKTLEKKVKRQDALAQFFALAKEFFKNPVLFVKAAGMYTSI
ncbi:MAG: cobalamin-dependent protein [Candidatus Omnitrophica bacterium]|nr:cobalamin-dependent protein [Candidatus Omnitrophota bacterium]